MSPREKNQPIPWKCFVIIILLQCCGTPSRSSSRSRQGWDKITVSTRWHPIKSEDQSWVLRHDYKVTIPPHALYLNYLAEGGALGHDDMKLALACSCVLEKSLNCPRAADGHDDFFGVDVLKRLHRNIVGGPLWKNTEIKAIVTHDQINLNRSDNYCIF